jgi:hypothetical protein
MGVLEPRLAHKTEDELTHAPLQRVIPMCERFGTKPKSVADDKKQELCERFGTKPKSGRCQKQWRLGLGLCVGETPSDEWGDTRVCGDGEQNGAKGIRREYRAPINPRPAPAQPPPSPRPTPAQPPMNLQ